MVLIAEEASSEGVNNAPPKALSNADFIHSRVIIIKCYSFVEHGQNASLQNKYTRSVAVSMVDVELKVGRTRTSFLRRDQEA